MKLRDAASKVGSVKASPSVSYGKGLYKTGAGGRKNNLVAANSAMRKKHAKRGG